MKTKGKSFLAIKGLAFPFLFLFFISCGTPSKSLTKKEENQIEKQASKEKIKTITPSIEEQIKKDAQKKESSSLIGVWECEELGDVLLFYGYSLPARLSFFANGNYVWEVVKNGVRVITKGTYKTEQKEKSLWQLYLYQTKEYDQKGRPFGERQKKELNGIVKVRGRYLHTVFYDREFIYEVDEFKPLDTQIYGKRK